MAKPAINVATRFFGPVFRFALGVLPDRIALQLLYFRHFRKWTDFRQPHTFSEKIQARKLAARDPCFPGMVDKIEAKNLVTRVLGPEWVIPTLWAGRALPPAATRSWPFPFVIKANNGSGTNIFVRSEDEANWTKIDKICARWMRQKYRPYFREWPYEHIAPKILIEPFIGNDGMLPLDYKFFVFNGRARYVQVDTDRETGHRRCFYDTQWNRQDFALGVPLETRPIARPQTLEAMTEAAERLCRSIDFARVDFYEIEGKPYFGEITLFPVSGLEQFSPPEWDRTFGDLWTPAWSEAQ